MPLRVLLILMLLVQQSVLPAAVSSVAQIEECVETSCCQVVETKTCCGETARETRCCKTGGHDCLCGLASGDSEPAPDAPPPPDRTEIAPIFAAPVGSVIDLPRPIRSQGPPAPPAIARTHNETQALLCIWRN